MMKLENINLTQCPPLSSAYEPWFKGLGPPFSRVRNCKTVADVCMCTSIWHVATCLHLNMQHIFMTVCPMWICPMWYCGGEKKKLHLLHHNKLLKKKINSWFYVYLLTVFRKMDAVLFTHSIFSWDFKTSVENLSDEKHFSGLFYTSHHKKKSLEICKVNMRQ